MAARRRARPGGRARGARGRPARRRRSSRRSTPTRAERVAIASSTGIAGEYEASSCYAYAQALAEGEDGARDRARLRPGARPGGARPGRGRPRGAPSGPTAMIGAGKPESRACPVVLDPTVAASFVGLIGGVARRRRGAARPLAVRRAARRGGRRRGASSSTTTASTPTGPPPRRSTARASPRRRTALIEGGRLRTFLFDTYTASRGGAALDRQRRAAAATARCPAVSASNLVVGAGRARASTSCSREAGDGVFVTDVAGLHSGVNPVSGVFSVGASGRAIRGGELAEPLREFTIASDLVSMLRRRAGGRRGGALGAVRRLGQHAAAADRRDDRRRRLSPCLAAREPGRLTPWPLLDCGRLSTTDGDRGAST